MESLCVRAAVGAAEAGEEQVPTGEYERLWAPAPSRGTGVVTRVVSRCVGLRQYRTEWPGLRTRVLLRRCRNPHGTPPYGGLNSLRVPTIPTGMPPQNSRVSLRALLLAVALGLNLLALVGTLAPSSSRAEGSVVLVNQTFNCANYPQPVDFDLVKVTITAGQDVKRDAFQTSGSGSECTGRIRRVEIDTWVADGIKIGQVAHDLVIEGGYVRCHGLEGDVHQDGIQAMGGNRVTLRNLLVNCSTPDGVNSAMFINQGSGENGTPTDIVCDGCTLMKAPSRNRVLRISDSVRSGARNSTIVWCGTGSECGDGPAVMVLDGAASDPVERGQQDRAASRVRIGPAAAPSAPARP